MKRNNLDFVQITNSPDSATDRLIVFDVLTIESPVGYKGERIQMYVSAAGYSNALKSQKKGDIVIVSALCPWE